MNRQLFADRPGALPRWVWFFLPVLWSSAALAAAPPAESLPLSAAIEAALAHYPDMDAAQAAIDEAQAMRLQAEVHPNPQLELLTGRIHARRTDIQPGNQQVISLAQPLQWPAARTARQESAQQTLFAAEARRDQVQADLTLQVKLAYLQVLRAQEAQKLAKADQGQIHSVRDRIKAKVTVGEAARYQAVKAEAEALGADRRQETAQYQLLAARRLLSHLTASDAEPIDFLTKVPRINRETPPFKAYLIEQNPRYLQTMALISAARARIAEARAERIPAPTLRAGYERTPDSAAWLVGVSLPIALFDQRRGQIAAAEAALNRSQAESRQVLLTLERELEQGELRYKGALTQLEAIDGGLLLEATDALRVAEASFRAGEGGILDVLDASRTLRAVRLDRLNALFDTYAALFELERTSHTPILRDLS
ncbi:MAG: TolC family protein [Halothiobacillus sp.]